MALLRRGEHGSNDILSEAAASHLEDRMVRDSIVLDGFGHA
jgi:hypothetical protein